MADMLHKFHVTFRLRYPRSWRSLNNQTGQMAIEGVRDDIPVYSQQLYSVLSQWCIFQVCANNGECFLPVYLAMEFLGVTTAGKCIVNSLNDLTKATVEGV